MKSLFASVAVLFAASFVFADGDPREEKFRDPPSSARFQIWWQCFGSAFTKQEITRELEAFKKLGLGGVTVKDTINMPSKELPPGYRDIDYMSPEWLDMFAHAAAECKRLDLVFRQRFGSGWNEGGPWITPEMSSQTIAFAKSQPVAGPAKFDAQIPAADGAPTAREIKSGDAFVVAVLADKQNGTPIDLTAKVGDDLKLVWDVPKGKWIIFSCFGRSAGSFNMSTSKSGRGLHADHLRKAAADVHIQNVAQKMLARLDGSPEFTFEGLNFDSWEINNPTWTPGFRQAFIERRGYDPVPYLPVMSKVPNVASMWSGKSIAKDEQAVTKALSPVELRFLQDFRLTVSDLIVENFFVHVTQWCREHNISFEAEAGGGPSHTIPNDLLQAQGAVDVPMGELWLKGRSFVKIASSAAHAYGKRTVSLETLTHYLTDPPPSPADMKKRCDEAFLLGGNQLCSGVSEYSPAEAGLPGWVHSAGPHINHCLTYGAMLRPFFDYVARCSYLLQQGENVAQAAVYRTFRNGATGLWVAPADDGLSGFPSRFAFDYVGDELIQKHMSVRDGRIVLSSGATYGVLCIHPTRGPTMPLATLQKIRDLIAQGVVVAWMAEPPTRCPGLTDYPKCDADFNGIVKELKDAGRFRLLSKPDLAELGPLVEKIAVPPAWRTLENAPLRFVHRRTPSSDIFFVVNRGEKPQNGPVQFRVKNRNPELWNPETGEIHAISCEKTADGAIVKLNLSAHDSMFVVFRENASPAASDAEKPTSSFEPIAISGPWQVEFPENSGAANATFKTLRSWTEMSEPNVKYFSGIATYRTTFDCPASVAKHKGPVMLDLGRVADVCEVNVNGRTAGIRWRPPYRFDVSGLLVAGENRIEIRVANTWLNRLVGDASLPPAQRISRMTPQSRYAAFRNKNLQESGLLGPVQIAPGQ